MPYKLYISRNAQKELSKLDEESYYHIKKSISDLGNNPRPIGSKKLVDRDGWRIRIGNYRVVYEIDDAKNKIIVLHIGHRRDIYN